jgi:hypothetical protein
MASQREKRDERETKGLECLLAEPELAVEVRPASPEPAVFIQRKPMLQACFDRREARVFPGYANKPSFVHPSALRKAAVAVVAAGEQAPVFVQDHGVKATRCQRH